MNKNPKKINLTSNDSLFEKSLNLQKYIEELSSQSIDLDDKFSFTWAGKSNAIKSVLIPSKLTLNPKPEESIKWNESENLFIEGDNLEVLKLLQKAYFEKVKMIYIDPPYNTGHDFVYNDDFSSPLDNYLKQTGQKTESGESTTTNKETNGRYHSDWLSMMYPRLKLAWNLLREDGVIFVSIDDNEVHHLRMLMDEIFGEENFVANIVVQTNPRGRSLDKYFAKTLEYVIVYSKSNDAKDVIYEVQKSDKAMLEYDKVDEKGQFRLLELRNRNPVFNRGNRPNLFYSIYTKPGSGKASLKKDSEYSVEILPLNSKEEDGCWTWSKDKVQNEIDLLVCKKASTGAWRVFRKDYVPEDGATTKEKTLWIDTSVNHEYGKEELAKIFKVSGSNTPFDFPKSIELVKKIIRSGTKSGDNHIVLDFFAGSSTTAHAVLSLNYEDGGNRKFIMVQLPEKLENKSKNFSTICDVSRERIRRVINGYGENPQPIDAGFKAFALTESNYPENTFVFNPEKSSEENQEVFITYLDKAKQSQLFDKENDISIIYENIVKEGLSLNSKVNKISLGKNNVYQITDGEQQFFVCLERKLTPEAVKALTDKLYKDKLFICLESALDDTMAANLALNLDLKTI